MLSKDAVVFVPGVRGYWLPYTCDVYRFDSRIEPVANENLGL
jgi:hypothetical protein